MSTIFVMSLKKGLGFLSKLFTSKSFNSLIKKEPTKPEPPIVKIIIFFLNSDIFYVSRIN